VKILFFVLSAVLLSSCSHAQFDTAFKGFKKNLSVDGIESECQTLPYDNSDSACNIYGWQAYAYQSLLKTQPEYEQALNALGHEEGSTYKRLILLTHRFQQHNIRHEAALAMFDLAKVNPNSFGQFFYLIASYTEQDLKVISEANYSQEQLEIVTRNNAKLKTELTIMQTKIQGLMDIEKKLNTNEDK
jgi:hypothetical protein